MKKHMVNMVGILKKYWEIYDIDEIGHISQDGSLVTQIWSQIDNILINREKKDEFDSDISQY